MNHTVNNIWSIRTKYFAAALSAGAFNSVNDAPFFLSGAYSQCNHMKGKKGMQKETHSTKLAKVPPLYRTLWYRKTRT